MTQLNQFTDLLKLLDRQPSVVGAEHSFFREIQRELEQRGAQVTWYEGLLVAHGNDPESAMFSAHIDRHGLICTGPNEFQYAAFVAGNRSDLLGNSVSEKMMLKVADRFPGERVFAYEPWSGVYRGVGSIRHSYICPFRNNLIFEVEGLEHLVAGTPVAFAEPLTIEGDVVTGQLDNVLTAALLIHMFSLGFEGTAFFTAEEEAGRSWRYLLEWFRRFGGTTNRLIVVDTSPYPDVEASSRQQVVLRRKDANASFGEDITNSLEELCVSLQIPYAFKDAYIEAQNRVLGAASKDALSLGSTEMGRIAAASNGLVKGTTLQIPTTGYHTTNEAALLSACDAFLRLSMNVATRSIP